MDSRSKRFRFLLFGSCQFDFGGFCCLLVVTLEKKMSHTDQNSKLIPTPIKTAQIIRVYLPPFLQQSSRNAPAIKTNAATNDCSSSCCHRREHKKYEQYATQAASEQANNIVRGSRNGRDRRKNFNTYCVSLATPSTLSLSLSTAAQSSRPKAMDNTVAFKETSISWSSTSLPPPISITTSTKASTPTLTPTQSCPSQSQYDHCRNDEDRILKTNSHLVDSRTILRNTQTQLVMPIGESRLGSVAAETPAQTWACSEAAAHTQIQIHNNISQTTTLECRCFKKQGDIYRSMMDEESELEQTYEVETIRTPHKRISRQMLQTQLQQLWQQMTLLRSQVVKTLPASKLLLVLLMLMLLTSSANCWAGRQDILSNCTFPARWEGSWFLSGYQQSIHIKGSQFSYRGRCAASDGNKYLIVDEKGCHRCLVIYEKHKNVLQYKESECEGDSIYMHQSNPSAMAMRSVLKQSDLRGGAHPNTNGHSRLSSSDQYILRSNDDMNDYFCKGRETLQNLCDQIPGDALLYSLFRESAEPVKCPLKGPFVFTYNRGHGECKSPASNIESCTEDSRLLLSFQACPDVQGTESTVEELTCLATWKDGNSRYLVGLVSHHHAISNEERYRCFVYEKLSSLLGLPTTVNIKDAEYKLAQSGDATCNGLDSAEVGSRIMSLRKPPLAERCDFPAWFKGPRHWHALMGNAVYNYHSNDGSVHIIKPNGYMETRALCEQINKQTSTEMMAVVHYTTGCQSGFMCMMFYRRDTHVIEIQTGKQAARLEDACAPDHFDVNKMPYITLLASNPDPQICPMEGLYNLRGAIGPPYLTTRHKRNHNNKAHGVHGGHHHPIQSQSGVAAGGGAGNVLGHKRHSTLSFRSSDRIEKDAWHSNTRGLPVRNRRATANTRALPQPNANEERILMNVVVANTSPFVDGTASALISTDLTLEAERQRNRREIPGCITNYKAQRQLWIGCTEPNVIDVRPLCTDEGDEEYSCHGSWSENGTVFIIARHKGSKHGVCISYRPMDGSSAKLVLGDACYRGAQKPQEHHLVANLSVYGKCGETHSSGAHLYMSNWWRILAVSILTTLLGPIESLQLGTGVGVFVLNHR